MQAVGRKRGMVHGKAGVKKGAKAQGREVADGEEEEEDEEEVRVEAGRRLSHWLSLLRYIASPSFLSFHPPLRQARNTLPHPPGCPQRPRVLWCMNRAPSAPLPASHHLLHPPPSRSIVLISTHLPPHPLLSWCHPPPDPHDVLPPSPTPSPPRLHLPPSRLM